jgi:hypothetical protein
VFFEVFIKSFLFLIILISSHVKSHQVLGIRVKGCLSVKDVLANMELCIFSIDIKRPHLAALVTEGSEGLSPAGSDGVFTKLTF